MLPTRRPARKVYGQEKLTVATVAKEGNQGTHENLLVINLWKKATVVKTHTSEAVESTIHEVFMQYSTLLLEEARQT